MMRLALIVTFVWCALASGYAGAYDYPIDDPLLATVIGTRPSAYPPLPARVPSSSRRLTRVDPQSIPRVFWDENDIRYSVALQPNDAPLVFLIAGTGSRYSSGKMTFLEALLWGAGCHVAAISSPTHPDFILAASRHHLPGFMPADVADLYALMQRIRDEIAADAKISSVSLVGFSLGGTEAGFLAAHDEREKAFGFHRVLLLNPAVSLFDSVEILDEMFVESLPEGGVSTDEMISGLLRRLTPYLHQRSRSRVDDEFLYTLAAREDLSDQELRAIIATVFRLSLANMVFTSDVMLGGGHVVERGVRPGVSTSLTEYMKRATRFTFQRYLDEMLLPYWRDKIPGLSRESIVRAASLESIRSYLAQAEHVRVITNEDDIILNPANLAFLRDTFGARATIYPRGGHGGNLYYSANAERVLELLAVEGTEAP
jgi:hypothetical protein